jgi:hypothetical protein
MSTTKVPAEHRFWFNKGYVLGSDHTEVLERDRFTRLVESKICLIALGRQKECPHAECVGLLSLLAEVKEG